MAYVRYKRRWYRFWKVEYWWVHSGYGTVVGWAWTKGQARRRAYKAVFEMVHPSADS